MKSYFFKRKFLPKKQNGVSIFFKKRIFHTISFAHLKIIGLVSLTLIILITAFFFIQAQRSLHSSFLQKHAFTLTKDNNGKPSVFLAATTNTESQTTQTLTAQLSPHTLYDSYDGTTAFFDTKSGNLLIATSPDEKDSQNFPSIFEDPKISQKVTAIRIHKKQIVFLITSPHKEPLRMSFHTGPRPVPKIIPRTSLEASTLLSIAVLDRGNKTKKSTGQPRYDLEKFILPYTKTAWQKLLPDIRLSGYGATNLLLRLSKKYILKISMPQKTELIALPNLIKNHISLNSTQSIHYDSALSSQENEFYFLILNNPYKEQDLLILRCSLKDGSIISRHSTRLNQADFFALSEEGHLITTKFENQSLIFTFAPLQKKNLFLDLFNNKTTLHTLTKELHFSQNIYPKRLRFNGKDLIGFYQEGEQVTFWNWN